MRNGEQRVGAKRKYHARRKYAKRRSGDIWNAIRSFNLPDFTGRVPVYDSGSSIGITSNGKLPNITGGIDISTAGYKTGTIYPSGSLQSRGTEGNVALPQSGGRGTRAFGIALNAALSSAVYTDGQTSVVPANINCFWCIKF